MAKHRFVYLLGRARHRLMCRLDELAMQRWGITSVQLGALFALEKNDGCQLRVLADILDLDKSAVTGLTKRLVSAGVAEKVSCELDRRASRLYLTERGRAVLEEGHAAMDEINLRITGGLSANETNAAANFLHQIINNFAPEQ